MKQHYNSFYSTSVRINFYLFIGLICSVYTFKFLYHPPTVYRANVADCFYGAGWEERILTYVSFNRNNNTYQLCHVDYGTNIMPPRATPQKQTNIVNFLQTGGIKRSTPAQEDRQEESAIEWDGSGNCPNTRLISKVERRPEYRKLTGQHVTPQNRCERCSVWFFSFRFELAGPTLDVP